MDLVSIILPYYKKKDFILLTIQSILKQTYKNFEVIIVNDDQSNESKDILENIKKKDTRISIINNENNFGAGLSRNEAIKIAKGKYLAFCDADDLWEMNKLENQLNFMKKKNINFSFTSYNIINDLGNIIGNRKAYEEITFKQLLRSCDIGLSTVIVEKKTINDLNINFPNIKTKEDYVVWLYLSKNGVRIMGLQENLTSWRKLSDSLSSSIFQKILDGYRVYRVYLKLNIVKSLFYLFLLSVNFLIKIKK
jgi:teichuronic acid biosynthesis glycosyltransferase TuaG